VENEEHEKQLSHEKTATTVDVASKKVERTTNVVGSTVTGRTAWDALVDMGTMLGRLTPWIIIVAGALYGVYKFTTLTQDAQKAANDKLTATYEEIGKMHDQQMGNLKEMFELQNTIEGKAKKKAQEADDAQKDAKEAIVRADLAKKDTEDILKKADQVLAAQARLAKNQRQLYDRAMNLAFREKKVTQRAAHITELKAKLLEIADKMVGSTDPSIVKFGKDIQKEASDEAKNLLSGYVREFGKNRKKDDANANALNELVGSSAETLETTLTKEKGLGFTFWQKYHKTKLTTYIGVVRQTGSTADGVVLISTDGASPPKEISDMQVFAQLVSIAGRDPDDWSKRIAYNVYLRPTGELGIDAFTPNTDHWTIPEAENDFKEADDKEAKHEKIFGSETPMEFMSLDDFKKREIYRVAKASYRGAFSNMLSMLENEMRFDPKKIADATGMPTEIRAAFVQLLAEAHQESLKHGPVESASMIASGSDLKPEVYGRIAAMALMNGFKVENTQPSHSSSASPTKDLTSVILCGYSIFDEPSIKRHARLTFTHEGSDGKWMLLKFENPVVLPSTRAE
jgi:hypothetical protein